MGRSLPCRKIEGVVGWAGSCQVSHVSERRNKTAGEVLPPGKPLTGPALPRRSVCAPGPMTFTDAQATLTFTDSRITCNEADGESACGTTLGAGIRYPQTAGSGSTVSCYESAVASNT